MMGSAIGAFIAFVLAGVDLVACSVMVAVHQAGPAAALGGTALLLAFYAGVRYGRLR